MSVRVQEAGFDVGLEFSRFTQGRTDIGGIAMFVGLVRSENGEVSAMTLDHYPGMTERQLEAIEAEARNRWALDDALIVHRVGRMLPGEGIVLVLTASAHRKDSLEACQFLIDWLKTKAPFWKFEEGPQGGQWVDAKESDEDAARRWT